MRACALFFAGCLMLIQGCAVSESGDAKETVASASAAQTQLHSSELAFSITVPHPWQIQVKDARLRDRAQAPAAEESSSAHSSVASAPLLIVSVPDAKAPIPPTIQVNYRDQTVKGKQDPVALLKQQLHYLSSAYQTFTYQSEPEPVRTRAHDAACARFKTQSDVEVGETLQTENVTMKFCLIPQGNRMFMIAMAADAESFPNYLPSFEEMLDSVRL